MKTDAALFMAAPEGSAAWWFLMGYREAEAEAGTGQHARIAEILKAYAEIVEAMAKRAQTNATGDQ